MMRSKTIKADMTMLNGWERGLITLTVCIEYIIALYNELIKRTENNSNEEMLFLVCKVILLV
ncbi:MAG: hypothetical protein VZR27_06765 [Acutalibacteraceae bacterium]|nr:hypothetical protein [Acutalibacteraceae bacterium]